MNPTVVEMRVRGMDCQHCVRAVTQAVHALDPAAEVRIDLAAGHLQARTAAGREAIAAAVAAEGYEVEAD